MEVIVTIVSKLFFLNVLTGFTTYLNRAYKAYNIHLLSIMDIPVPIWMGFFVLNKLRRHSP